MGLVILGSGGLAAEVFSWALKSHDITAFFSEDDLRVSMFSLPILKSLINLKGAQFVIAVGDPLLKERFWDYAIECELEPCDPIIHHTAVLGHDVYIDKGSILCPMSVVTSRVKIGCAFTLNLGATVGHDCAIGDFVNVAPGANISGNVTIGDSAAIGTSSCIRERLIIGDSSVVGMGAVVTKNVPSGETVVGNPARLLPKKPLS